MSAFQTDEIQRKLIEKARQGDVESFETLILSCKLKAYNIAYRYLRNEEDAKDALQDTFIKIYKGLSGFNGESKFETWVYRIVVNTCNDYLRKRSRMPKTEEIQIETQNGVYEREIKEEALSPEEELIKKETCENIIECMEKLKTNHKEMIILRDIKGFSYEEIAQILELTEGTVKSRISRARQKLREIYLATLEKE